MNWKEQFKEVAEANNLDFYQHAWIEDFINTLVIEKLIEDIPDAVEQSYSEGATAGADGVYVELDLKQQLRRKWLNEEN